MKTAKIGSISHGTLRTEDLLSTFISELEGLMLVNGAYFSDPANRSERDRLNNFIYDGQDCFSEDGTEIDPEKEDLASELVNQSFPDALNQFAPSYCYFGSHEGDGSDIGYWPSMEQIDELPDVENGDEAKELGEDCKFVNDHGNVTVYGGDGSVILELV